MAELLIFMRNGHEADSEDNAGRFKPGDVVSIHEDGHIWGKDEQNVEFFRIIKVTGVKASDLSQLLASTPEGLGQVKRIRMYNLDVVNTEDVVVKTAWQFLSEHARKHTGIAYNPFKGKKVG